MDDGQPSVRPPPDPSVRPSVGDAAERWVSFADLAEQRGISRAAASKLVRRHKWRRQTDNQGRVMILVPEAALDRPSVRPPPSDEEGKAVRPSVDTDMSRLAAGALAALEDAVAGLREQLDTANARAERAEADRADERLRVDNLRAQIDQLHTTIDELKAGQTLMTEMHARELAVARHDAQAGQQAAAELRRAEEARKARGRLRRAWDGWLGR
jgi:hypothetical protein